MTRPRGSAALFDLLDQGVNAPSGHTVSDKDRKGAVRRGGGPPTPGGRDERPVVIRTAHTERASGSNADQRKTGAARRPLFEVDDDCVRMTLTPGRSAVLLFLVLLSAVGAFEFGRRRGDAAGFSRGYVAGRDSFIAEAEDEIEAAREAPANSDVVADLMIGGPAVLDAYEEAAGVTPTEETGAVSWIPGYTYVVAQGFQPGHEADAARAQAFLYERGLETVLVRFESGATQLISRRGFNRTDPTQRALADQLLERIRQAGADYFASGGGYKLEGYFATFKGGRW